ncbi:ATP-binding protein [Desulfofustis glycolicus]|uniref:ATP-binding protein n=1 Tax=Desulfofustis glycolicus TaxID=51195 RepID=UPI001160E4D6|nr:ATP-binding protein [Desulfofustis glycolicus]MCB2218238.1 ATP-binding protein [Desulfobulbaceae bacterium]
MLASPAHTLTVRLREAAAADSQALQATLALAGYYIRIDIADQGHGIAREHLKRVFDP